MWKDFFYYSKSERRAILILLLLLFIFVNITLFYSPEKEEVTIMNKEDVEHIRQFLAEVHEKERVVYSRPVYSRPKREIVLAPFDPNLADSIELLTVGIPPFVARNIIKYRKAGGRFKDATDLSKIYGLSEETFKTLEPYIYISEAFRPVKDTARYTHSIKTDTVTFFKYEEGTLVDVNRADTTELKKIPGIGSGIARLIVAYRQRLGGFYDLSQLKEVEFVNEEMMRWFELGEAEMQGIHVNKAGLDKLRAHPYINFYQAKVIVEYRKKRGKLKGLSQLSLYEEFTEKDLNRLSHYLIFD